MTRIAIIGGGAAGCFCAIQIKRRCKNAEVHIFESKRQLLAKVAVTGGGRCNLTNSFADVKNLKDVYPRGEKLMRRALTAFSHNDAMAWWEREGVRLTVQEDNCVFPQSQDAMEIVGTLTRLISRLDIRIHLNHKVENIDSNAWDRTVVTTGGHPTPQGFAMLQPLGLRIETPVPSLFTLNVAGDWHQRLMGTVVKDVQAMIAGTKFKAQGDLLLTHWGMSGPAILRLSSYAARHLAEHDYKCRIAINWLGDAGEDEAHHIVSRLMSSQSQKLVTSAWPQRFVSKHWEMLLQRANVPPTQRWGALNAKQANRLCATLTADAYEVTGKCAFKEEFVTCGGVSLKEINPNTMEARRYEGLYFAGEVTDVDAVTGGFNLQAAWSMAYVAAESIAKSLEQG